MIKLLNDEDIRLNPYTRLNIYCVLQPPHRHTFFEFVLILSGTCKHFFNGENEELLEPGTLILIRPSEYHQIGFAGRDCVYRDFYILPDEMKTLCDAIGENFYETIAGRKERFRVSLSINEFNSLVEKASAFNNVDYTAKEKDPKLAALHKTIILELLGYFIRQDITEKRGVPDWLNDLYLHIAYSDYVGLSVEEIVAKTGYSHGYVSQSFKKYFHTSLISFHNRNKVLYSCKLLGNMKIIDISSMLGWENPKNYAIEFAKVFGCSPSQYIKRMKQGK